MERPDTDQHTTRRRRPDPEAWDLALELARGDVRLLDVAPDGRSITIRNAPR